MKKDVIIFTSSLFILIIAAFVMSTYYFQQVNIVFMNDEEFPFDSKTKPEYHFKIIAQNTEDPFWKSVKEGASKAADEYNVAFEFNGPRFTNLAEELQYLEIAIASKVDGIAVYVIDEEKFTPVINKAVDCGIPVVTIEADAKSSKRHSFIGSNNFQVGQLGGKLVSEATKGKAKTSIIVNSSGNTEKDTSHSLIISGLSNALKSYSANSGNSVMQIEAIKTSKMGIFSAGEVTNELLNEFPDVNVIFCTESMNTIGVAQVIVDMNRVGDISIIGYGDLPEIWRYIEKEVIYGTIVSDPVKIGFESIRALVELKRNNLTSTYVDTGAYAVTRENIDDFNKNSGNKSEKEKMR